MKLSWFHVLDVVLVLCLSSCNRDLALCFRYSNTQYRSPFIAKTRFINLGSSTHFPCQDQQNINTRIHHFMRKSLNIDESVRSKYFSSRWWWYENLKNERHRLDRIFITNLKCRGRNSDIHVTKLMTVISFNVWRIRGHRDVPRSNVQKKVKTSITFFVCLDLKRAEKISVGINKISKKKF